MIAKLARQLRGCREDAGQTPDTAPTLSWRTPRSRMWTCWITDPRTAAYKLPRCRWVLAAHAYFMASSWLCRHHDWGWSCFITPPPTPPTHSPKKREKILDKMMQSKKINLFFKDSWRESGEEIWQNKIGIESGFASRDLTESNEHTEDAPEELSGSSIIVTSMALPAPPLFAF